jgi:hypothetical protein
VAELLTHFLKPCDPVHGWADDREVEPSCRSDIAVHDFANVKRQTELKAMSVSATFA